MILILLKKSETSVYYTYEISNNRLMITNLQGVGYHLCNPEITTQTIVEEELTNQRCL